MLGTNQVRPAPYVGTYNFPEVASYVGILALIAACALLAPRWRRRPEARSWWVWYAMLVIGVLSALGRQTPFGHLMFNVPGMSGERLLNRNLLLVDFALAALLGWWAHLLIADRRLPEGPAPGPSASPLPDGPWQPGRRVETVLTCLPVAVVAVLAVLTWAWGARLEQALGVLYTPRLSIRLSIDALVAVGLAIAGTATWVALSERRFPARKVRRLLSAVLVIDLLFFVVFVIRPPVPNALSHAQGPEAVRFSSLVGDGRFLIYDPDIFQNYELYALGQTDLNLFRQQASAQGYAALIGNDYYLATGAHLLDKLDPSTLATPTWDELNVHVLLSLPSYFVTPVEADFAGQGGIPFPHDPNSYIGAPTPSVSRVDLEPGQSHLWYFGGALTLDSGSIPLPRAGSGSERVGLVTLTGATRWLPTSALATGRAHGSASSSLEITLRSPTVAAGVVVENTGQRPMSLGIPNIHTADGGDFDLDGRLQYGVNGSHWKFTGTIGSFGIFTNTRAKGWAWATSSTGGSPAAGTTVATRAPDINGTQRITVDAAGPVDVVRSMAWAPGWHATIQPRRGGPAVEVPIEADQPVQRITIPGAGRYVVTFTYEPTSAVVGIGISVVTAVALASGAGWALLARRRRAGRRRAAA